MTNKKPKYHIITFGCQMNKADSERVAAVLTCAGYSFTAESTKADIIVINACSVRQTAIDRIWGMIKNYQDKREAGKLKTILTGCLLPQDKEKLETKFDFVFNIKNLSELEDYLGIKNESTEDYLDFVPQYSNAYQASIPIMTGCNNFCSYCAVPYARGREVSRSVKSILSEIKALVKNGYHDVTLLGQNVNSFLPMDKKSFSRANPFTQPFAKLLWEINQIDGIERIWFMSAHPKDMCDDVIQALGLPKMLNYLHLAMQSGDNTVLKRMNRQYTIAQYKKIIKQVRTVRPNIALGTDIIVGFPGETKEQFENTLKAYKELDFDISFHSKYSPRKGTVSATFVDDVSREEKVQRWQKIQALMEKQTLRKNKTYKNQTVSVLVDKFYKGYNEGNSREMKRVRFKSPKSYLGKIVEVKINKPMAWMLEGDLIENKEKMRKRE